MRILVADDHALVRRGIREIINEHLSYASIQEACTGEETLIRFRSESFDFVILDINLPDKNGIEVLKNLKKIRPETPIIVLSVYPDDQYGIRALKAGATSYLTKGCSPEELVMAMKKAFDGGRYISQSLAERMVKTLMPDAETAVHENLSNREFEVLVLIGKGLSITEISDRLSISVKTVSTYRSRLTEKLSLHSTPELIRYAMQHQLDQ